MTTPAPLSPSRVTAAVIIPHYRDAERFRGQIAALKKQIRPADEIMVVDDASPEDDFRALIDVLRDHPDVILHRRPTNGGPSAACNDGLYLIKSDCVAFVATDDIVYPDFIAATAALLEQHPQAAFAFADPAVLQEGEQHAETFPLCLAPGPAHFAPQDLDAILRRTYLTFATNTMLFRAPAVKRAGGTPPELKHFGDTYLNFVVGLRDGACYVPRALGTYFWTSKSYAGQLARDRREMRTMTEAMIAVLTERHSDCYDQFRAIGVLPAHNLRVLGYLLQSPAGRRYLTPKIVLMCTLLGAWHGLRLLLPPGARRAARRLASRFNRTASDPT